MTRIRFNICFTYSLIALFAFLFSHSPAFAENMPSPYELTSEMVAEQIAQRLADLGAAERVEAYLSGYPSAVMARANAPLEVEISGLDYEAKNRAWRAHMRVRANTETVFSKDIQGRFNRMVAVPVLNRRMDANEVITDVDIENIYVPESRLRGDVITDGMALIGQSPRRTLTHARPIRTNDISRPILVEKGSLIKVHFQKGGLHIHTLAEARENAGIGDIIPVLNVKSEALIQARILSDGNAEVVDYSQHSAARF